MRKNLRKKNLQLKSAQNKKKEAQAASSSSPPPPWLELPREVTADILHRLGVLDILEKAQKVCTSWRNLCKDPSMWRVIDMKNLSYYAFSSNYLEVMCRHAVYRSKGQLTDLHIDYFATDELMEYISERSSQLKCLRLRDCNGVSGYALSEAAKRFPLLEEVHFLFVHNCNQAIEGIGRSCPKLRSFTLSGTEYRRPQVICNEDALAIAKGMPGLRQLRLMGNNMSNEGLEAILDSCPLLESLDIRKCYNVDLSGDLGKRVAQKIIHLQRPHDPMEDCEWSTEHF